MQSAQSPPQVTPQTTAAPAPRDETLWQKACDFEAMTLGELLKPMFATVDTAHGPFGGGEGEAAWQPMMIDAIAKRLAARGGIGLAGHVYAELLHRQEAAGGPLGRTPAGSLGRSLGPSLGAPRTGMRQNGL